MTLIATPKTQPPSNLFEHRHRKQISELSSARGQASDLRPHSLRIREAGVENRELEVCARAAGVQRGQAGLLVLGAQWGGDFSIGPRQEGTTCALLIHLTRHVRTDAQANEGGQVAFH